MISLPLWLRHEGMHSLSSPTMFLYSPLSFLSPLSSLFQNLLCINNRLGNIHLSWLIRHIIQGYSPLPRYLPPLFTLTLLCSSLYLFISFLFIFIYFFSFLYFVVFFIILFLISFAVELSRTFFEWDYDPPAADQIIH